MHIHIKFIRLFLVLTVGFFFLVGSGSSEKDSNNIVEENNSSISSNLESDVEYGSDDNNIHSNKGYFPNLSKVNYITSSGIEGILDDNGTFEYNQDDNITFYIKDIKLGTVEAKDEISVFSFKNPKLVAQTLYSLDSDLNPSNGLQIEVKTDLNENKIVKNYQKIEIINLDLLDEETQSYKDLIESYGGDLIKSTDEAVLNELNNIIYSATITDTRVYQYLLGQYYIASSSKYNIPLVQEAQQNIENRIKRFVYSNVFIKQRAGLQQNFSSAINEIDENYQEFTKKTAEEIKEFKMISSGLSDLIKNDNPKSMIVNQAINYLIDDGTEFMQLKLGDGTGSDVLGATSAILKDCILKAKEMKGDSKAVGSCLATVNSELIQVYLKNQFQNDPIFSQAGVDTIKLVENFTKMYLTCEGVIDLNNVNNSLSAGIDCVSEIGANLYESIGKIVASTDSLWSIKEGKTEFYSKDTAYALLEDYSYLGSYEKLMEFLKAKDTSLENLLLAEYNKVHPNEDFDLKIAEDTYRELLSEWNREVGNFKIKYAKLLKKENGRIVGVTDDVYENYYGEVVLNINGVRVIKDESDSGEESYFLDICYSIKNNIVRDIDLFGKSIDVFGESGKYSIDISNIKDTLTMGQPINEKVYCNKYLLNEYDKLKMQENFTVSVKFDAKIKTKRETVVTQTFNIEDLLVYEGVDLSFISPITVGIKSKLLYEEDKEYFLSSIIGNRDSSVDYYYTWTAIGATIEEDEVTERSGTESRGYGSIFINLKESKANIKLVVSDYYGNFLAETSINISEDRVEEVEPLLINNIYKLVESNKEFIIQPIIVGGEQPYKIKFYTDNIDDLEVLERKDDIIRLKISSIEKLKTYNIKYEVEDNLNNIKEAYIEVRVYNIEAITDGEKVLPAPTNLKIQPTTTDLNVSWDEVIGADAYKICMSTSHIEEDTLCNGDNETILSGDKDLFRVISDGLEHNKVYYFRVKAFKDGYNCLWSEERVSSLQDIPTLPAPTNLKAISNDDSSITLSWDSSDDIPIYEICMSNSSITDGSQCQENGGTLLSGGTSNSRTITDLESGKTYYFRVRGLKDGYIALWSNEVSITNEEMAIDMKNILGTVADNNGNPISNINVKFEYLVEGAEESKTAITDNNGHYKIEIDSVYFTSPDTTYLIYAYKDGYTPSTKTFKISSEDSYTIDFTLNPIKENEVVLEIEPQIHHLGDDYFSGSINSQFQKKSEGTEFEKNFKINSTQYNNYSKAILKFEAKGIQDYGNTLTINGKSYTLSSSPSDGNYETYSIELDKEVYNEGSNSLTITSGKASSSDYDDFEFSNIILEFEGLIDNNYSSTFYIKKTGQTISYAKYDDGFYKKGITLNYTKDNTDILDRVTGLVWQNSNDTNDSKKSWSDAKYYCEGLIGDWRLPTRQELSGLVRYDKYNPSIDDVFDYTTADYYWTEDISLRDEDKVWVINFNDGIETTVDKTTSYYVRCVKDKDLVANAGADILVKKDTPVILNARNSPRINLITNYLWENSESKLGEGETLTIDTSFSRREKITLTITGKEGREDRDDLWLTIIKNDKIVKKTGQTKSYADYDDGAYQKGVRLSYSDHGDSVIDNATGLEWKDDESSSVKMTWEEANEYCSRDDSSWRLPTRRELSNLVDYGKYNPSIDESFNNTISDYYWTIDTSMRDNDKAWAVSFNEGIETTLDKSVSCYVRCLNTN